MRTWGRRANPNPDFRVDGHKSRRIWICFACPWTLHIETNGNPEEKQVEVVGTSSDFSVDTFGEPRNGPDGITLDPKGRY